jgi:hypothetical protein
MTFGLSFLPGPVLARLLVGLQAALNGVKLRVWGLRESSSGAENRKDSVGRPSRWGW